MSEETAAPTLTPEQEVEKLVADLKAGPVDGLSQWVQRLAEPEPADLKEGKDFWPGRVRYYGEKGNFTGGKMVLLRAGVSELCGFYPDGTIKYSSDPVERFNQFFADNPKALCISYQLQPNGDLVFIYSHVLSAEEQDELDEINRMNEGKMYEWRQKREKAKREEEISKQAALLELERLAKVGADYEYRVKPNLKKDRAERKAKGKKS